jgi:hypothetical protein
LDFDEGSCMYYFEHHLRRRLVVEDSDIFDNELIELMPRCEGLEYIPKQAICMQKYYMRQPRGFNIWVLIRP